jgi:hypothetical protein
MNEDVLGSDIKTAIQYAGNIKKIVDTIYYSEELGTFFNRPFLSMLSTAADFLSSNLKVLFQRYVAYLEKKK